MPSAGQASVVSGVVLAAGSSSRLQAGHLKQLLEFHGESLVRRAVQSALDSRLQEVIVVVGHAAPKVKEAVAGLDVRIVENRAYEKGQSTSVKAGLRRVDAGADAAMFLPVDQPLLSPQVIDRLLAAYAETGGPILVPVFEGRRGAPVLFDRALFPELARISGDEGGRQLFGRYRRAIVEVPLADGSPLLDIDELQDLERLQFDVGKRGRR